MLISESGDSKSSPDASTIICYSNHYEGRTFVVTALMILAIVVQLGVVYVTWSVNRKTALFPLKGRAPRLMVIQLIYYLILGILPIIVEFLEIVNVDWGKTQDTTDTKQYATRRFLKTLIFLARFWVVLIYAFRVALIYANWKVPFENLRKTHWRLFGNEMRLVLLFLAIQLVMFTPLFILSKSYITGYASLDSYFNTWSAGYTLSNPTFLHIVEISLLFGSLVLLRKYPREFMVKQEILFSLVVNVVCAGLAEFTYNNRGFGNTVTNCFLWTYTMQYLLIIVRTLCFTAFIYLLSKRCLFYFPLPFAWIFKDFSKFIFEPYCIRIFEAYLVQKEPSNVVHYEKIMESYLGRPEEILGEHANDFSINHEDVSDNIERLGRSFENFKKTNSFRAIYDTIKQFEEINRRIDR